MTLPFCFGLGMALFGFLAAKLLLCYFDPLYLETGKYPPERELP